MVPDARRIEMQVIFRRAADVKRKMADDLSVARLLTGKDAQLDHQKRRRVDLDLVAGINRRIGRFAVKNLS